MVCRRYHHPAIFQQTTITRGEKRANTFDVYISHKVTAWSQVMQWPDIISLPLEYPLRQQNSLTKPIKINTYEYLLQNSKENRNRQVSRRYFKAVYSYWRSKQIGEGHNAPSRSYFAIRNEHTNINTTFTVMERRQMRHVARIKTHTKPYRNMPLEVPRRSRLIQNQQQRSKAWVWHIHKMLA